MAFFETSAMTDINVEQAFMTIAKQVKDRLENFDPTVPIPSSVTGKGTATINKKNLRAKKKGGCC